MPETKTNGMSDGDAAVPDTVPVSVQPLTHLLDQLRRLVETLDGEQYNTKPDSTRCGAIGGHVRHTLDHIIAWLGGIGGEIVNYDDRQRGTDVETNPQTALVVIERCVKHLSTITPAQLTQPVAVFTSMTNDGSLVRLPSTHARELAFVFSHTVHHNAIIGAIARALDVALPENFGMAPSTVAYRNQDRCAR